MTDPEAGPDLHRLAAGWLREGVPVPEVERRLAERGVGGEDAAAVVDAVLAEQAAADTAARRSRDRAALIQGVGLCAGALALAGLSFTSVVADQYRWPLLLMSVPSLLLGASRLVDALT
jgi:hypothetical protein